MRMMPRDKLNGMAPNMFLRGIYTLLPIEKEANDIMQTDIMKQHERRKIKSKDSKEILTEL